MRGEAQLNGTAAHKTVDSAAYSTSSHILQGIYVYSEQYDLHGKIDIFNTVSGNLCERKKRVQRIYDGYIFQLYAQFFCLQDMGYTVKKLSVYEIDNSERILYNIVTEINNRFAKEFDQCDSVYIFQMSKSCKILKFGYAKNEDKELIIV
ncbi:MAG: type V CRISPR-associated protein Cas4 [Ruminococcaceae bacterium]|nr:type V CRISPR-associated protein Cas4 [Oscillospiraceae bacterium]